MNQLLKIFNIVPKGYGTYTAAIGGILFGVGAMLTGGMVWQEAAPFIFGGIAFVYLRRSSEN